jgi:NADH-quinone oxidoreductase subunit F
MVSLIPTPHPKERRIIFENISIPGYAPDIETYLAHGGYESLKKALKMKPVEIIDALRRTLSS